MNVFEKLLSEKAEAFLLHISNGISILTDASLFFNLKGRAFLLIGLLTTDDSRLTNSVLLIKITTDGCAGWNFLVLRNCYVFRFADAFYGITVMRF